MIIELLKILSSIFFTSVLVFGYANHFKQEPILTFEDIPYTQFYDLEDFIEEYEEFKEEGETIHETTPSGDVILLYNKETEQFQYYSNNEIPYRHLEVVARKFVLTYDCLELYVDKNKEYEKLLEKHKAEAEAEAQGEAQAQAQAQAQADTEEETDTEEQVDVFVQYKSYNQQNSKIKSNKFPIKEEILSFKCIGTIHDYETNTKSTSDTHVKEIGFSDYKKNLTQ